MNICTSPYCAVYLSSSLFNYNTRIFQVLMLIRNKRISAYMVMSPFGSNNSFLKALIIARHIVVESKVVLVLGLIGLRSIVPPLFFRHLLWSGLFSLPVLLSKAHWGVWENATKCQFLEKLTTYFELYLCWRQSYFLIKSCVGLFLRNRIKELSWFETVGQFRVHEFLAVFITILSSISFRLLCIK